MSIDEVIDNLRTYLNDDCMYQDWKSKKINIVNLSDFDMFCIEHCSDIDALIKAYKSKERELKLYKRELDSMIKKTRDGD